MTDLKTIGAIVGIGGGLIGVLGPVGTYFVSITHLQDAVATLEKSRDGEWTQLNTMRERENNMDKAIAVAGSDISGQLKLLVADVQHVKETLAEIRDAQKHPSSNSAVTNQ